MALENSQSSTSSSRDTHGPEAARFDSALRPRTWINAEGAAKHAGVGTRLIYREIRAGRMRAARIGGRRDIRTTPEWVDEWLLATAEPVEIRRRG